MMSKRVSIGAPPNDNPFEPPSANNAASSVLAALLSWLKQRAVESLICFTLATAILPGWAVAFQLQRFTLVSCLLLTSGILTTAMGIIVSLALPQFCVI